MLTKPSTTSPSGAAAGPMFDLAKSPDELRILAAWYREFAEQAGNPVIWESRLLMADSLDAEAQRVEDELADARDIALRGEL